MRHARRPLAVPGSGAVGCLDRRGLRDPLPQRGRGQQRRLVSRDAGSLPGYEWLPWNGSFLGCRHPEQSREGSRCASQQFYVRIEGLPLFSGVTVANPPFTSTNARLGQTTVKSSVTAIKMSSIEGIGFHLTGRAEPRKPGDAAWTNPIGRLGGSGGVMSSRRAFGQVTMRDGQRSHAHEGAHDLDVHADRACGAEVVSLAGADGPARRICATPARSSRRGDEAQPGDFRRCAQAQRRAPIAGAATRVDPHRAQPVQARGERLLQPNQQIEGPILPAVRVA